MVPSSHEPMALCASTSSSGLADGLGRRWLAFDREEGTMLERLVVRPELAAFETLLRDRIDRLAILEDERIARPRTLEHAADGTLVIISEFVPGSRLSDLLEGAAERGAVPGVDAAFGFLLDVLPALCGLHAGAGFAHGTIAPARMVLTPAGQVVLLDAIYGDALARLRYTRRRLWCDFDVAVRPSPGAPRLDNAADVSQAVLAGVMLVLGRPLQSAEYAAGLAAVLVEAAEIAEIRVSTEFAQRFSQFLERALPISGPSPYASADDALIALRELAAELGGIHGCRRALIDFIEQIEDQREPAREPDTSDAEFPDVAAGTHADELFADATGTSGLYDDSFASIVIESEEEPAADGFEQAWEPAQPSGQDPESDADAEIDLDAILDTGTVVEEELYCLDFTTGLDDARTLAALEDPLFLSPIGALSASRAADDPFEGALEPARAETGEPPADGVGARLLTDVGQSGLDPGGEPARWTDGGEPAGAAAGQAALADRRAPAASDAGDQATPREQPQAAAAEPVMPLAAPEPDAPAPLEEPIPSASSLGVPALAPRGATTAEPEIADEADAGRTGGSVASSPPVRRRREKRVRSARARKDKLRSARSADTPPSPPAERPAPDNQAGSWMVRPDRVAAFAPSPDVPAPNPQVVPFPSRPAPVQPAAAAPPVVLHPPAAAAAPALAPPPGPFGAGLPPMPPAPPPFAAPWASAPNIPAPGSALPVAMTAPAPALRLKNPAPPPRPARAPAVVDIYAAPPPKRGAQEAPSRFPSKIAVAVLAVILVAVVAGRASMPARSAPEEPSTAAAAIASAAAATPPYVPPAAPTGRLEIDTQPAGARVLLNGKPAGDTPLTIDAVPAGRHTVTFVAATGSVTRTVRVAPGQTIKLDVPIFSGWVGVFAPFILEVSAGGRVIGTTDEPRLMLSPGRHELTLVNRDLGFRAVQSVNIEPGEVRTLTIDPRGTVNLNATPWAEVWIDGRKVGDTPIANLKLPLGTRDVVFRHPQLGERRGTITIRGDRPAVLSMDMTR